MTELLTRSSLVDIRLWRHQQQMLTAPAAWPAMELFFLVAGYGSGKSFTGAMMILSIAYQYYGHEVTVGLGSDTIKRLRQTLLADLFRLCEIYGISYQENRQEGTFRIGTVLFVIIAMMNPGTIFGHNFSIFLGDEIDELAQEKAVQAFTAVQERTRVVLPDGRQPYSMFMTTAQGYRGTFQIVNDLQDKSIPYILMHGRTRDNLALPASYYRRLFSIYNKQERRVYLDGEFANLTTGRVYYDYDEAVNRLRPGREFKVTPDDVIHVGQDFNVGYSMGTAYVKRDRTLYVVNEWSFANIGHAPKIMRQAYPENEILWYPDVSGNEIMAGYKEEIREQDIEMRIGVRNPSVTDRIFVMNKLFAMRKLFLFPSIRRLSMALKVRQFDDNGDPEKGKGPNAPDHPCDSAEYPLWRIVRTDPDFQDIYAATRMGRSKGQKEKAA